MEIVPSANGVCVNANGWTGNESFDSLRTKQPPPPPSPLLFERPAPVPFTSSTPQVPSTLPDVPLSSSSPLLAGHDSPNFSVIAPSFGPWNSDTRWWPPIVNSYLVSPDRLLRNTQGEPAPHTKTDRTNKDGSDGRKSANRLVPASNSRYSFFLARTVIECRFLRFARKSRNQAGQDTYSDSTMTPSWFRPTTK